MDPEYVKATELVDGMRRAAEDIAEMIAATEKKWIAVYLKDNAKAILHSINAREK